MLQKDQQESQKQKQLVQIIYFYKLQNQQEAMNSSSGLSNSQNSSSTLENMPALYQFADEINENIQISSEGKIIDFLRLKVDKDLGLSKQKAFLKKYQLIVHQDETNISELFDQQHSATQKSPDTIYYPGEKLILQTQQFEEEKKEIFEKNDQLLFITDQPGQCSPQYYNESNNSECEKEIQKQIMSLDLEASGEFGYFNEKKADKEKKKGKKKLNVNSTSFISQNQLKNFEFQLESNQNQQRCQTELQISNVSHQAKMESLSCEQFRDYYLSEQLQQQQLQFPQFLESQTQNYISLPSQQQQQPQYQQYISPQPQLVSQSCQSLSGIQQKQDQIIVQTIHNPFILEISQKVYTGYLKYFDPEKQYGFIVIDEENRELFFHFQDVTHYLLTLDFLHSVKEGRKIKLSFNICQYRGKQSTVRQKAVNLAPIS